VEVPAESPPLEPVPSTLEASPVPIEVIPAPIEATSTPETDQPLTSTGQMAGNDPLPPEAASAPSSGGPTPDPIQPPSAAAPAQTSILHTARDLLNKARISIQDRKRKKRDKIMAVLNTKTKITNDEVEKLLHVSDATAERYLAALVKEGKLKQEKRTGAGVAYTKI